MSTPLSQRHRIAAFCSKEPTHNPIDVALRLVGDTLQECGVISPPVNTEHLCEVRRVQSREVHLVGCDARLFPRGDYYIAEVNASDPEPRKRFSLCHELGHTFFDQQAGLGEVACDGNTYEHWLEERICNMMAAEFLMPRSLFSGFVKSAHRGIRGIRELSNVFGVSAETVAKRIIDLDLWPFALLTLQKDNGKLKFQSYKRARSFVQTIPISTVMKAIANHGKSLGEVSLTADFLPARVQYYSYCVPSRHFISALLFSEQ